MAALPTPLPLFVLNTRKDGVTKFIQPGTGFLDATSPTPTSATVTDMNTVAANRYTFTVTAVDVLTPERAMITVSCTPPANKAKQGKIRIVTTTGANLDDSGPVPTVFLTRRHLAVDHSKIEKPLLKQITGSKQVVHLPVTGFGDLITGSVSVDPALGKWKVLKAKQKDKWVAATLKCEDAHPPVPYAATPITGCITVTLTSEDDLAVDVPMDATFTEDPDEDP